MVAPVTQSHQAHLLTLGSNLSTQVIQAQRMIEFHKESTLTLSSCNNARQKEGPQVIRYSIKWSRMLSPSRLKLKLLASCL